MAHRKTKVLCSLLRKVMRLERTRMLSGYRSHLVCILHVLVYVFVCVCSFWSCVPWAISKVVPPVA